MKRKQIIALVILAFSAFLLLTACTKPSQAIMGTWHAQDKNGKDVTIVVTPTAIKIGNQTFKGDQRISGADLDMGPVFSNEGIVRDKKAVDFYGFVLEDNGKNNQIYVIAFPDGNDKNIGLLIKSDFKGSDKLTSVSSYLKGTMLYAMNKKTTPSYHDSAQKYLKAGND